MKIFMAIATLSTLALEINAAEINVTEAHALDSQLYRPTAIYLQGDIVDGDFSRFLQTILTVDPTKIPVRHLVLGDSAGGNLIEAMKIGELANELHLKTYVIGECLSACAMIALASQYRVFLGGVGLHRPYIDPAVNSSLTPSEAQIEYQRLSELTRGYLGKNYVTGSNIDKIFQYSSTDVWFIEGFNASEQFGHFQPPFHEWIKSVCHADDSMLGMPESCVNRRVYEAQDSAFAEWIKKMFEAVNDL